ncbi:MAG: helix-turn-helix domain-containing protein [Lachnospiraceae bacterium]|nr:helix-turn-helix domain-containing protein [Lachnospiraceae bacterium]
MVQKWETGVFEPSLGKISIMADYFGVSLDGCKKVQTDK